MSYSMEELNHMSLKQFRDLFVSLSISIPSELFGNYHAAFVVPAWLRASAAPALSLTGLSGWWGKEFFNDGTAINIISKDGNFSTDFHANEQTHITQNRQPASYWFMKLYSGPLVDGTKLLLRTLKVRAQFILRPLNLTASMRVFKDWHKRIMLLSIMQNADNQMAFTWSGLFKKGLKSATASGKSAPAFIQEANDAARAFAKVSGGVPHNSLLESALNMPDRAGLCSRCDRCESRSLWSRRLIRHERFRDPC